MHGVQRGGCYAVQERFCAGLDRCDALGYAVLAAMKPLMPTKYQSRASTLIRVW
jgi:hypothetical protein